MNELIPEEGAVAADFVLNLLIYSLTKIGKKSANMYIEQLYIKNFAHEEMIDKIDQYQNIS